MIGNNIHNNNLKVGYYQQAGEVPVLMTAAQYLAGKALDYFYSGSNGQGGDSPQRQNGKLMSIAPQTNPPSQQVERAAA